MKNNNAEKSDETLVLEFKNGEMSAFDVLVKRHKDSLVEFITRFIGDYQHAEDIAQETFFRVYKSVEKYRPLARFSTWLYRIAINLSNSYLRQNPLKRFLRLGGPSGLSGIACNARNPSSLAEDKELGEVILRAVGKLSKKHRIAFIMRDIQGMTYEDISFTLGCSIGTVKSRLNRARRVLKDILRPYLRTEGRN